MLSKRILIIHDETDSHVAAVLSDIGYKVVGRTNSIEAGVSIAKTANPDLIVLDLGAAQERNFSDIAAVFREFGDIPVLCLTTPDAEDGPRRTEEAALQACLAQPIVTGGLSAMIEKALSGYDMEQMLRETADALRLSQRIAQVGSWQLDLLSNALTWSDEVYRIFGMNPREFSATYEAFLERVHPDDRMAVDAAYSNSVEEGKDSYEIEHRIVHSTTGEVRHVHEKCRHFKDSAGRIVRSVGIVQDVTDRKRLERERDQLFNLSMDMLCVAGFDGFFKQINPAWTNTLGWRPEQLLGRAWIEFVHPDDRAETRLATERLRSGKPVYRHENRYRCRDGSYRWLSWNSFPFLEDELIFAAARDTTDRKESEAALSRNQQRLRAVVEHLPEMLWMKDTSGRFLLVNETFASSCGRASAEEVVGKTDFDVWPHGLAELYTSDDKAVMAQRASKLVEEPIMDRDEKKWFETFKTPLFDSHGAVVGTVGSARDITPRKNAEEALRRSEEKYRKILETIADGYHEVDLKGNLTLVNDSFSEILGYGRDELAGINYRALMDEDNAHKVFSAYNAVYRTGIPNPGFSLQMLRRDGSEREASVSIALLKDSEGKPIGFHGTLRDVTDLKGLEEQLRQAVKMEAVGRLAGGIAHDFNNLLTAIMGYAVMLERELPEQGEGRRKLERINRTAVRAADLTKQLLAFSRKQVLDVRTTNINDLIRDIESMLRRLIGEDIDLITDLDKGIGSVKADQAQLEQVVVNLAVNSRDAMPDGGILTIETRNVILDEAYCKSHAEAQPGWYVMLSVGDTGHGIRPGTAERIFDPFFTTKAKGVGTGLGLSTVYGTVKQHDGHVTVYSEPARGTTFKIYLPLVDESPEMQSRTGVEGTEGTGTETVLLVEDEEVVRDLAGEALEMLGYTVLAASSPSEAVEVSNTHEGTIDLLLTDVVLPQMDGKTLFETLARKRPEMKVLYVSGYTENFIVHRGILDPDVSFLPKPFTVDDLAGKVRGVLDRE